MIEEHVYGRPQRWRDRLRRRRRPMVLALFSYRYDAHLVPALLDNIRPMVDGWVAFDDRRATGLFSDERERRRALFGRAVALGTQWVLFVEPDIRVEDRLAGRMDALTAASPFTFWTFALRELFAPDRYRIDGIWGRKTRSSLFRLPAEPQFDRALLHGAAHPVNAGLRPRDCGLNLYHLKMIDPARRRARHALYRTLDPGNRYQRIGYDYLVDETGLVLERIPRGRGYSPPHRDDGGLWMAPPDPAAGGRVSPGAVGPGGGAAATSRDAGTAGPA